MAINTVGDLLDHVRLQLNSEKVGGVDTYALWTDAEIIDYIDQAQQEFSRLTLCLSDYTNFVISILSDTREYEYSSQILEIQGGYLSILNKRVYALSFKDFERSWRMNSNIIEAAGDWEDDTGPPKKIITDLQSNKLVLYPNPTADDTLTLYVFKIADSVDASADILEIDQQYRLGLTYKVMSLAYQKADSLETEDLQKSMLFSQKWKSFWQDAKTAYDLRYKR